MQRLPFAVEKEFLGDPGQCRDFLRGHFVAVFTRPASFTIMWRWWQTKHRIFTNLADHLIPHLLRWQQQRSAHVPAIEQDSSQAALKYRLCNTQQGLCGNQLSAIAARS